MTVGTIGRVLLCAGWLPFGIAVVFAAGDFDAGPAGSPPWPSLVAFFALMWLFGIPLVFAVRMLLRRSWLLAWAIAVAGALLSLLMFFLSVPLPSFANAAVPGVLAWLVAGCVALASR